MPIKGLTDRAPAFPQIGVLRKGSPKQERGGKQTYGRDLDHFRFDTDDQLAAEMFAEAYGAEPRRVNVYLPYETTAQNFETCKEAWTASALQHRCDGELCTRWLQPNGSYSSEPRRCPGGCKPVGRLKIIIPELRRMVYVVAETHSIHDIISLQEQLLALEALRGSLRGIPMILGRSPREISTPRDNGQRVRVTKHLLHIEAAPAWVDLQLAALEQAARPSLLPPTPRPLMLPDGLLVDEEGGEIVSEAPVDTAALQARVKLLREAERDLVAAPPPFTWRASQGPAPLETEIDASRGRLLDALHERGGDASDPEELSDTDLIALVRACQPAEAPAL